MRERVSLCEESSWEVASALCQQPAPQGRAGGAGVGESSALSQPGAGGCPW